MLHPRFQRLLEGYKLAQNSPPGDLAKAGRKLQAKRRAVPSDDGPNHLVAIAELPAGRDAVRQCTAEEAWGQVHAAVLRWIDDRTGPDRRRAGVVSRDH